MFELAMPFVLFLLPLPFMIWFWVPRAVEQLPIALKIPFFKDAAHFIDGQKRDMVKSSNVWLLFIIWSLLLFALAGPRFVGKPQPLVREGYNIMMALDISGSMELQDMVLHGRPATRLAVVKRAAEQFVRDRVGDKIGLILFGSRAYLLTPLTYDRQSILSRLEDTTVGLAGKTTSIGDALGLAIKRLEQVPKTGRVIILLTDGVNNSGVLEPLKASEFAREEGIKIYTIGLGSEDDPRYASPLFLNMAMTAELDEGTLKEVARITGGRYFRATDLQSLQTIYKNINQMEKISSESATVRPQHDYYHWPLALAVFLFIFWLLEQHPFYQKMVFFKRREVIS